MRKSSVVKMITDLLCQSIYICFFINRLLMIEVSKSMGILAGEQGKQVFTHDLDLLREHKYNLAGKFVAWSVIHGGPGLSSLSTEVYSLMISPEADVCVTDVNNLSDVQTRNNLEQVSMRGY